MTPIQRGAADAAAARRTPSQPPPLGEFMRATSPLHASVSNSTYGLTSMPHGYASDTFWSEPLPDAPPYRRLVESLLAPLGRQVTRADVLRDLEPSRCGPLDVCHRARLQGRGVQGER